MARPRRSGGARRVAYDVLRATTERGAYANILLPALLRERRLDGRDAALATELTYGTLRARGTYDAILATCSDRPLAALDPPIVDALRLGVHQLLRTRIPAYAAVDATVGLVRTAVGPGPARYANAVLRKVAPRDLDGWLAIAAPAYDDDPIGHLAIVHSHPPWVVAALRDALGGDRDEIEALLAADNVPPSVTLLAKPGLATADELAAAGARQGWYSPYAAHLTEGDPAAVTAVREGRAAVQDEGSQLVTLALADLPVDGAEHSWLDLCAGPGGKASLLAGLARPRGVRLLAAERRPHRARLVRDAVAGAAGTAHAVVADAGMPAWPAGRFDRVLLDAPCTGLGALRRRPELRWRRSPDDLIELTSLQRVLLENAIDAARPGGLVAYVTCSPHLAETREIVDAVSRSRRDVVPVDPRPALPALPGLGAGPYVQLWPHRHGTDAMFLAVLRRTVL
ncbi:MAG: RsmB/NOP family class I SAM-dependent RNA methyltransferase [Streptosporangiaceae bacterium]